MENKLSIVVLTQNEENSIVDCLESAKFASELIVVDDQSTDRTVELAKQFTKNIFTHPLDGNFSSQRNFALNHTHGEWILFLDADERISKSLAKEILGSISGTSLYGYFLKRTDYMWGKAILHGEAGNVKLLRLARKDTGRWKGRIHEVWKIKGKTDELSNPLIHVPHQSVSEFVSDVDSYSTLRARELYEEKKNVTFIGIITYPVVKFFQNYFFRKGYIDGVPGFLYAMIMSFHSFLVRGKLYLLNNNISSK